MSGKHKRGAQQHVVGALVCIILLVFVVCIAFQGRPQGSDTAAGTETQTIAPAREQAAVPAAEQSSARGGETQAQANDAATLQPTGAASDGRQDAATTPSADDAASQAADDDATTQEPQSVTSSEESHEEVSAEAARSYNERFAPDAEGKVFYAGEVLISVDSHADPAAIEALLAQTPGLTAQSVNADQVATGLVSAKLDSGVTVEDGLRALDAVDSPLVSAAQPNYIYTVAADGAADDVAVTDVPVAEDAPGTEDAPSVEVAPAEQTEAMPTDGETQNALLQDDVPADEQTSDQATTPAAVDAAQNDALSVASAEVNDTRAGEQWALKSLRAYDAWELAKCGDAQNPIAVAVLDDGFNIAHEDLTDNIIANSAYNSFYKTTDVSANNGQHGTHVMGIVSAVTNNQKGIAGMSYNAKIVPIKVFNNSGEASTTSLVEAYNYILKHPQYNVRVVNLSAGSKSSSNSDYFEDYALIKKVREAEQNNIATVVAACNSDSNNGVVPYYAYPSDSESVVSVMNLWGTASTSGNDSSGQYQVSLASSSNYNCPGQGGTSTNRGKNICAPGSDVLSTFPDGYGKKSGTSMASPYVAGVMALEFAANPNLTVQEAIEVLYATAHDLGDSGWDERYGYGEADAYAAVRMALGTSASTRIAEVGTITASLTQPVEHYVYDGVGKRPGVTVTLRPDTGDGTTLAEGEDKDYVLEYANNVDHGMATVTITGKGQYEGKLSLELHFGIARRPLDASMVTLSANTWTYDARSICPSVTVTCDNKKLVLGTDFTTQYASNKNAGTATVTVSGAGNYEGAVTKTFTISRRDINTSGITASCSPTRVTYNGSAQRPRVTLKHSSQNGGTYVLDEGDDYTLSYANNTKVGTAKITVTGKGNYSGTRTLSFTIAAAPMSSAAIAGIGSQAYTGAAITPAPSVTFGGRQLSAGSDYTVGYRDNVNAGTATVTITGKGNFTGTASTTFQIIQPHVSYRTHVQRVGWQSYVSDGAMSGTSGRSLRLEGINIALSDLPCSGGIEYRTHVQRIGWQGWRRDGAMSGTKGKSLRLEAIEIRLYGEMANRYDVYYRVHCQRFGWMGWASNGARSGSAGYSRRLEGIQIVLVPKGQPGPPTTYQGISQNVWRAFAQKGKK